MATTIWRAAGAAGNGSVGFWDGLNGWTVVLAAVAVLGAVVMVFVLGTAGRPRPEIGRTGGLTRALERAQVESARDEARRG